MVNTWKNSYFQNDGIRVLFVLPQSWTDAFIPMNILPKPREVVRVMVGRLELLSPEREQLAESAVRDLAGPDPDRRLAGVPVPPRSGPVRRADRASHRQDDA